MPNITGPTRSSSAVSVEPTDIWYWIIRGIIAVLTITGNGLVIYFITFKRRLRVTNNWFVLSLAIADFSVGLFTTPSGLACTFQFQCDQRVQLAFYNFLVFASNLNLWGMAIDRYIAIVHSLRYSSLMTTTRVILIIAMSWSISFLATFVRLLWLYDSHLREVIEKHYILSTDIFFGVFSCVVLLTVYARILCISRQINRQSAAQVNQVIYNHALSVSARRAQRNSSARVLGCMVLLFIVCYSLGIYVSFCKNFKLCSINSLVASLSLLLVHCNCAVNFVVYAFLKSDIRMELMNLCRFGRTRQFSTASHSEFPLSQLAN